MLRDSIFAKKEKGKYGTETEWERTAVAIVSAAAWNYNRDGDQLASLSGYGKTGDDIGCGDSGGSCGCHRIFIRCSLYDFVRAMRAKDKSFQELSI